MGRLKEITADFKENSAGWFSGELTLTKRECWLFGAALVLSGILLGILLAPAKNGISWSMFSNNGNHSGNDCGNHSGNDNGSSNARKESKSYA